MRNTIRLVVPKDVTARVWKHLLHNVKGVWNGGILPTGNVVCGIYSMHRTLSINYIMVMFLSHNPIQLQTLQLDISKAKTKLNVAFDVVVYSWCLKWCFKY